MCKNIAKKGTLSINIQKQFRNVPAFLNAFLHHLGKSHSFSLRATPLTSQETKCAPYKNYSQSSNQKNQVIFSQMSQLGFQRQEIEKSFT